MTQRVFLNCGTTEEPFSETFSIPLAPLEPFRASWTFGLQKSRENALQNKEEFEKALAQGTAVKVSPSGMATIMGFPLASARSRSGRLRAIGWCRAPTKVKSLPHPALVPAK